MEFDNKIADLEKAIKARKKDLKELESMYCDAQLARDNAKVMHTTYALYQKMFDICFHRRSCHARSRVWQSLVRRGRWFSPTIGNRQTRKKSLLKKWKEGYVCNTVA